MPQRFRIGAHIGSGGYGTVEEATRILESGEEEAGLAQKKLLARWLSDAEAVERFTREVRLLDEMDHPNICPVLGRNLSASPPWFIMPRAEANLADVLASGRGADRQWVAKRFTAILVGMAYAHASGRVVHRDLKPENVLIVNSVPVISDFGLGKRLDPGAVRLTQSQMMMGTMAYMAPEQFTDAKHVGPSADVYALGKILWEMFVQRPPVVGRPPLDEVPDEFRSFISRCTAEAPADRFASASDALVAFRLLTGTSEGDSYAGVDFETKLRDWRHAPEGEDADQVAEIANLLVARRDDEELFFQAVPRLDPLLIGQLMRDHRSEFDVILRSYNRHIQGGLPFDYCDIVANFYRRIFMETNDVDQKRLILERLIQLGPSHNRWHVGEVLAEILESIAQTSVAGIAEELLRRDETNTRWIKGYISNLRVAEPIARAFADISPTSG